MVIVLGLFGYYGASILDFLGLQYVQAGVAVDCSGELFGVGGFDEFVDQCCGGGVSDAFVVLGGGDAEADEQMCFACAGVSE